MIEWSWSSVFNAIPLYNLFVGLGLIAALFLFERRLDKHLPERRNLIYVMFFIAAGVGWLGAHVTSWLVTEKSFLEAGFTFYGGLLVGGIVVVVVGLFVLRPAQLWRALNCAVIPLVIAHAIGRLGCFAAGCCYGDSIAGTSLSHPVQLYEAGFLALFAAALLVIEQRNFEWLVPVYLLAYPAFRFGIEFLRADGRGQFWYFSTSQWISVVLFGTGLLIVFVHREKSIVAR